ncbi:glycosyltransferase family 4 protein [Halobacterium salinarum]|uniref:glycosyltransferase family 4 protein n=1 Tax=Halobacterium salinarum TaxID=2242 RepID=UPI00255571BF|nr:glycosyltransferase family 4 protein [Halobacterium salinarum]MDL0138937.1 glycosyltransferase family 4 protein [Halobacterium salinarum]
MEIGIITPQYPPNTRGGGEISSQILAEQLATRTDHAIEVHSFDGRSEGQINGVPVIRHRDTPSVPEISSLIAAHDLWNVVEDFDILHAYNMELHPAVGILSKYKSIPSVAHLNSYTYIDKRVLGMDLAGDERLYNNMVRPVTGGVVKRSINQIDHIIALSNSIREIYRDYLGSKQKISRVTNMIDPEVTPESVDYNLQSPARVLYVGGLDAHKGVQFLIKSLDELNIPVEARIVGGGESLSELRNLVKQRRLEEAVELCGYVPYSEVSDHYEWGDIFVHPGTWPEPLNRTLLEAMQHGLAAVVTNRGGPPEIVGDEQLIVQSGDPTSLAEGIDFAVKNRQTVGKRNRRYILENHHPKKVIPEITSIYQTIA